MKGKLAVLAAATFTVVAASVAPAGAASAYGPGQYKLGPHNSDPSAHAEADPSTGKVTIFQHNTRQAAAVHCIGEGPRATLKLTHSVSEAVSKVTVNYTGAIMSAHPVIDVLVTGSQSDWLGHGAAFGPKNNEAGSIAIDLSKAPQPGETLRILFGMQMHAGCLGHPTMLGLQGSRPVEGGQVHFTSVAIG